MSYFLYDSWMAFTVCGLGTAAGTGTYKLLRPRTDQNTSQLQPQGTGEPVGPSGTGVRLVLASTEEDMGYIPPSALLSL